MSKRRDETDEAVVPRWQELLSVARSYEDEGMDDKALASYQKAVALAADAPHVRLELALYHQRKGEMDRAQTQYDGLVASHPTFVAPLVDRAVLNHEQGLRTYELADLRKALALDPNHREALYDGTACLLEEGETQEARLLVDRLLAKCPDEAGAHYLNGLVCRAEEDLEGEIEAYTMALGHDDRRMEIHFNLGVALQEAGRFDEAAGAFRAALDLAPDDGDVLQNLGAVLVDARRVPEAVKILEKACSLHPKRADLWYDLGLALRRGKKKREAVKALRRAVELEPSLAEAHELLALVYFDGKAYEKAIAHCKRVTELDPESSKGFYNLGFAYDRLRRFDEALDAYKRVLASRPDDAKTYAKLGMVHFHRGDWDRSVAACERSLVMEPADNAEAHYYLGRSLERLERWDEARKAHEACVRADESFRDARLRLSACLRQLGLHEEAAEAAKAWLKGNPDPRAYCELALSYEARDRVAMAERALEKALQLEAHHAPAVLHLARLYQGRGRTDKAIGLCEEALEKAERSSAVADLACLVGDLHLAAARPKEALAAAERALATKRRRREAWALAARCHHALGDEDEARACEERLAGEGEDDA